MGSRIGQRAFGRVLSVNHFVAIQYLTVVNRMESAKVLSSERARSLRALPTPRDLLIPLDDLKVYYFTPGPQDELHSASREQFRSWEPVSRRLFSELSKTAGHILDVGAYSGVYGLTAAATNREARVTLFEPNPAMWNQIRENIKRNSLGRRVTLERTALTDRCGKASLFVSDETRTPGIASLRYEPSEHPINLSVSSRISTMPVEVSLRTLDSYQFDRVDLIKIDAEGSEPSAFLGAAQTLAQHHPVILSEALTLADLEEQEQLLSAYGYLPPCAVAPSGAGGDDCNYLWMTEDSLVTIAPVLNSVGVTVAP